MGVCWGLHSRGTLGSHACHSQYWRKFHFVFPDGDGFTLFVPENTKIPQNRVDFVLHDSLRRVDTASSALWYFWRGWFDFEYFGMVHRFCHAEKSVYQQNSGKIFHLTLWEKLKNKNTANFWNLPCFFWIIKKLR